MPKVSVIIAAYNARQTLGRAIESVQRQTLRDLEIVVADDASADDTYNLAQSLGDARIKCIKLPQNGGVSAARNAAIAQATGDWIAVLDADDWYEPNRLEELLKAAQKLRADLVCDNLKIYDHARGEVVDETRHGDKIRSIPLTPEFLFQRDNPLRRHAVGYIKPFMRREFLRTKKIAYNLKYRAGEDFFLLAEVTLNGGRAFLIPQAYYVYMHRISPTTRKISPHSRSEAGFALIVEACDELMQKYGASMAPAARRALQRKRWIFESRILCGEMIADLRQQRLGDAARILFSRPFVLILMGATISKMIYANILMYWRHVKRSTP